VKYSQESSKQIGVGASFNGEIDVLVKQT